MGRPPLPLGGHGEFRYYLRKGGLHQARALVRDFDGTTRQIGRTGTSRSAARKALQAALRERNAGRYGAVTPDDKVATVAELWWVEWLNTNPSPNSKQMYRDRLDRQILPVLGNLYVRELTVRNCDQFIQTVAATSGPGSARTNRAVLSNICGYAAKHDALARNPVQSIGRITSTKPRKEAQSLTPDEATDLRNKYHGSQQAIEWDLPDLLDFMMCTGVRISEACAVEWDDLNLDDLHAGTVRVGDAVVVREKGVGLYIRHEGTDTNKLKKRELELPPWMVLALRQRRDKLTSSNPGTTAVFCSPKGTLRDPSNTRADIRDVFKAAGYEWATSHTFRRTVASLMEASGLGARAAADQLGHSKVTMTQDHYFGRTRKPVGAKSVMSDLVMYVIHEEP
jgi:integrase